MKKIFSILLAGVALMNLVACSDADYSEKYSDPSKTSTVGVPQVFTAILQKGNTWMNPVYYRYYVQSTTSGVFSGINGEANGRGRFRGAGEARYDDRWKSFYDMYTQWYLLKNTYDNLESADKEAQKVFYYLGRTVMQSQLHEMLSIFGDVPYTGAGQLYNTGYADSKNAAVYDDDVEVYRSILADLKEAGDVLAGEISAAGVTSLKTQDWTLAAGDIQMWRKYTNSLRLRIALHLATNGDLVSEAKAAIGEILNNPDKYPLIDNNDENMGVAGSTENDTFNFGKSVSQAMHTNSMSNGSANVLRVMNVPANGIPDENTDPRLNAMYDANPDGEYIGYDVSMSDNEITTLTGDKSKEYQDRGITGASYICQVDSQAIAGIAEYNGNFNLNGLWIGAAEVALSKAEAYLNGYGVSADAAKAKECFVKGYVLSAEYYWKLKTGSSKYVPGNDSERGYRPLVEPTTADFTAYAEKIWNGTEECIASQLWMNFGWMNYLEAWNVVRRTGYPRIDFAKDNLQSNYPTPPCRLPYVTSELNYNATNYNAAIEKNYKESTGYYTPLFWAKDVYYNLVK